STTRKCTSSWASSGTGSCRIWPRCGAGRSRRATSSTSSSTRSGSASSGGLHGIAGDGRPLQKPLVADAVVGRRAVEHAAVVPDDQVVRAPRVPVPKLRPRDVLEYLAQQRGAFVAR